MPLPLEIIYHLTNLEFKSRELKADRYCLAKTWADSGTEFNIIIQKPDYPAHVAEHLAYSARCQAKRLKDFENGK